MCACLVTRSCLTLCDLLDCSPPGSSVHGNSLGRNTGVGCRSLLQEMNRLYVYIFQQNVFEIHPCCRMVKASFLFLAKERSLYGCTTFCSSIHLSMDIWIVFTFCLWWIIHIQVFVWTYLFISPCEWELLGHDAFTSVFSQEWPSSLPPWLPQFSSTSYQGSGFSISHPRLAWSVFLMKVILVGVLLCLVAFHLHFPHD